MNKNNHIKKLPKVVIYTDGACDPNPGRGGWGAILFLPEGEKVLSGGANPSTNNRMELTAAIQALRAVPYQAQITLYTDSQYLKRGIEEWLPVWQARNWRRKGGKLANVDLWKQLVQEVKRHQVTWRWIRGHYGEPNNERVNKLAQKAIFQNS
jgi:ribonuclease HI